MHVAYLEVKTMLVIRVQLWASSYESAEMRATVNIPCVSPLISSMLPLTTNRDLNSHLKMHGITLPLWLVRIPNWLKSFCPFIRVQRRPFCVPDCNSSPRYEDRFEGAHRFDPYRFGGALVQSWRTGRYISIYIYMKELACATSELRT